MLLCAIWEDVGAIGLDCYLTGRACQLCCRFTEGRTSLPCFSYQKHSRIRGPAVVSIIRSIWLTDSVGVPPYYQGQAHIRAKFRIKVGPPERPQVGSQQQKFRTYVQKDAYSERCEGKHDIACTGSKNKFSHTRRVCTLSRSPFSERIS